MLLRSLFAVYPNVILSIRRKWQIDVTLTAGEFKFRANDGWDINMGKGDTDGTLKFNAGNIASPGAGNYHVEMILDPVTGYKYTISPI